MQPVRLKKPSALAWGAACVLLLLVVSLSLWLLYPRSSPNRNPAAAGEQESVTLLTREEATLLRMEVSASDGSAFSLVRIDGVFAVEGDVDFPLEVREITLMVKDLTLLIAHGVAGESHAGEDLSPIGFTDASPRVTAVYDNGETVTLRFGGDAHTDIPADYLMVEGDTRVYLVSRETRDHFDRRLATLHTVPRISFTPDLLDAMEVAGEGGFTLSRRAGLWEVASPIHYPADETAVSGLLQNIGDMRLALWAGEATPENLALYGLSPAKRVVTFHLAPSNIIGYDGEGNAMDTMRVEAQDIAVSLGENIGSIGFYALYDGNIYQVSVASMGFLRDTDMMGLLARAPIMLPLSLLESLMVRQGGETSEYRVELIESVLPNNDIETDDAGNVLYDVLVTRNGESGDSEAFVQNYLRLMQLTAAGNLPEGYVPAGEPSRHILLTGLHARLSLTFTPYDALHYAMGVNGHYLFYVDRQQTDVINL